MAEEKEVKKGTITSQEVAVVNNIQALLNELLAMGAIDDTTLQDPKESMPKEEKMAKKEEYMDDNKEDKMTEKGIEKSPTDGTTANDKAEEKIVGDIPEESKSNMDSVAKALEFLIAQNKEAQKSTGEDKIAAALSELTNVVKSISKRQDESENVLSDVLKGLGVADEILKVEKSVEKDKPVRDNSELKETMDYIKKALGERKEVTEEEYIYKGSNHEQVQKGITSWLPKAVQEDK